MGSSTNPMSKCEKQSVLFIFEHKYAQSHFKKLEKKKKRTKKPFDLLNETWSSIA
jgi:hypothetical protein